MKPGLWIAAGPLLVAAIWTGCIPRHPTRTERPEVDLDPWEERTVRSESGHEHRTARQWQFGSHDGGAASSLRERVALASRRPIAAAIGSPVASCTKAH